MVRTPLVVRGPAGATSCMTVPYRFVRSLARSYGSWPYLRANDRYGLSLVPGLGGIPVRRPVPGQALVVVWLRVVAPGDIGVGRIADRQHRRAVRVTRPCAGRPGREVRRAAGR